MTIDPLTSALLAARLIQFTAVAVLLGGALFRLYAGIDRNIAEHVRAAFDRWLWQVLLCAAILALFSSIGWLLIQAAIMGDGWASAVSGGTLSTVLLRTEFGRLWTGRLALAGGLIGVIAVPYASTRRTTDQLLVAGLSSLLVASLAGTGHAVMANGLSKLAHIAAHSIHLLAAAAWLGGLLPLGYLLQKAQSESDPGWSAAAQTALPRYSYLGLLAVISLVLTGTFITWTLVGKLSALLTTGYGQILLAKLGLVMLMVGLALVNRLKHMPDIMAARSTITLHQVPLISLSRNVALEQGLGIIILAIVSVLGALPAGDYGMASARVDNCPATFTDRLPDGRRGLAELCREQRRGALAFRTTTS